jgi:large subunit ribosomal protein L18
VFRSTRYVYAQIVDDDAGRTVAAASSREPDLLANGSSRRDMDAARAVGKAIGERAVSAGVKRVVFDRGGCLYHGRVRAVAEGAREAGLEF